MWHLIAYIDHQFYKTGGQYKTRRTNGQHNYNKGEEKTQQRKEGNDAFHLTA